MNCYGDDVRIVVDAISADWVRTIHLMSSKSLDDHWLTDTLMAKRALGLNVYRDEIGLCHLLMRWRIREPIKQINFNGGELANWRMVIWALEDGDRVSEQAQVACGAYHRFCGQWPDRVLIQKMPAGAEIGISVFEEIDIPLLEIDWVVPRFLVVGKVR